MQLSPILVPILSTTLSTFLVLKLYHMILFWSYVSLLWKSIRTSLHQTWWREKTSTLETLTKTGPSVLLSCSLYLHFRLKVSSLPNSEDSEPKMGYLLTWENQRAHQEEMMRRRPGGGGEECIKPTFQARRRAKLPWLWQQTHTWRHWGNQREKMLLPRRQ